MCGIFGYVGTRDEAPQLVLAGLKKLEYRGYDSWGIASRANGGALARLLVEKHTGKIGQATTSLPAAHAALGEFLVQLALGGAAGEHLSERGGLHPRQQRRRARSWFDYRPAIPP